MDLYFTLKYYVNLVIFIDVGSREGFGKDSLARGHKKVGNPWVRSLIKQLNIWDFAKTFGSSLI